MGKYQILFFLLWLVLMFMVVSSTCEKIVTSAGDAPAQEPATPKSPDGFVFGMILLSVCVFLILILIGIVCYFRIRIRIRRPNAEEGRLSLPGEDSTSPTASTRLFHHSQVADVENPEGYFCFSCFRIPHPDAEEGRHSRPGGGSTSPTASTSLLHHAQVSDVQNPEVLSESIIPPV